jgi:hypothetical protein
LTSQNLTHFLAPTGLWLLANKKWLAQSVLEFCHAEITNLHHKGLCNSHRLHHHGEGEKALLSSAKKCHALSTAFFNK